MTLRLGSMTTLPVILMLLATAQGPVQAQTNVRQRNGVRIVGGNAFQGRLEVSSKDSWLSSRFDSNVKWIPVCDSKLFDTKLATQMCELLGYKFGRKYYHRRVNMGNVSDASAAGYVGYIYCNPTFSSRSLLGGSDGDTLLESAGHLMIQDGSDSSAGTNGPARRRLQYRPLSGSINVPPRAPYQCKIYPGPCRTEGPLVGLECSNTRLSNAPPPPPRPPRPPPAPPAVSRSIRLIGGRLDDTASVVEANLCAEGDSACRAFGRVELQVDDPSNRNRKIWAPLCSSPEVQMDRVVGSIVCNQVYDWPKTFDGGIEYVLSEPWNEPFVIPSDSQVSGDGFKASQYRAWATIANSSTYSDTVQGLGLKVSDTPCENRELYAVRCTAMDAGLPVWPGL